LFYGPYKVVAVEGSKVFVKRERDTIAVSRKDLKPYISPHELNAQIDKWKICKLIKLIKLIKERTQL